MSSIYILLVLLATGFSRPNLFKPNLLPWKRGICMEKVQVADFKPEKFFTGRWYELLSFGNLLQLNGICPALDTELRGNDVNVLYYKYEPFLRRWKNFRSKSDLASVTSANFKLQYEFLAGLAKVDLPVSIAATDYDNYAIFYSCQQVFGFKTETAWVMKRNREPFDDEQIKMEMKQVGLNYDDFIKQPVSDCPTNEPHL